MLNEALIESSTRILYSVKHLSGNLKVYWSKYLSFSFSSLTPAQVQQREIAAASKPFTDWEDVSLHFKQLTKEDQVWILASLKLLTERADEIKDWTNHRNISRLVDQLTFPGLTELGGEVFDQIRTRFSEFEQRKVFVVKGSIAAISFDYFLRWTLLVIGNIYEIDREAILGFNSLILLPVLAFAYWNFRRDRKYNEKQIRSNEFSELFKVKFKYSTLQYTILGFYLITGALISFLMDEDIGSGVFGIMIALAFEFLLVIVVFPMGRLTEHDLLGQTHAVEKNSTMDSDGNDEVIVSIETQLNSSTGRLEAYVLESALFGALAFSGFLQIIATDLVSFTDLENFASVCHHAVQSLVLAKWSEFYQLSAQLDNKINLFCLVSIETLVCSALFLAVIASRLRFSDVADKVRTALNLAKAYNEKEEAMLEHSSQDEKSTIRLNSLNKKIANHLIEAQNFLNGVEPIVAYMVYFRNAGLLAFLAVLVTSSLFITSFLGWGFIAIGGATWIYFNMKTIRSGLASFSLSFRIFYARHSRLLFALVLFPGLLGFLLSVVLHLPNTNFLIALSFILTGCYFSTWMTLLPHHDSSFGDIENLKEETWRSSSWRIIKNICGLLIMTSFTGFAFKSLEFAGANEMLVIGLSGMSFLFFFMGYYLTRPKWLGLVSAYMLGTIGTGLLFRIMRFAGAREMITVASVVIPIFYVLFFFRRKSFHFVLFRIAMAFSVLLIFFSDLVMTPTLWRRIQVMHEHRTFFVKSIFDLNHKIQFDFADNINPDDFKQSLKSCDQYIRLYGSKCGRTEIYQQAVGYYDNLASVIFSNDPRNKHRNDTTYLRMALLASEQMGKINSLFHWKPWAMREFMIRVDALASLKKIGELEAFLNNVIERSGDKEMIGSAKEILKEVNKSKISVQNN